MKYRDRNRNRIKLPSGAHIVIAKLNTFNEPFIADQKGDDIAKGVRLAKFALTNPANGPLEYDGETARIVDKPVAGENEITIGELDQEDANEIVRQVMEFSGLTKAGQEARKTFPETANAGAEPASGGEVIRMPSDRPVEAAAG